MVTRAAKSKKPQMEEVSYKQQFASPPKENNSDTEKYQHNKPKNSLKVSINDLKVFDPLTDNQKLFFDAYKRGDYFVALHGVAGTGKTFCALYKALEEVLDKGNTFDKIIIVRSAVQSREIGHLPGDVNEKLGPWMQPIFDNIDFLFGNRRGERNAVSWEELINQGLLHIEPLTYIRGRSLPAQYMIVDEAQNLSPHEVKTIITRAGEGTKIILTGDCEQIDSPYLDSINNGLAYCIDRLKDEEIVSHAVLKVGERSPLSEIASKKL